MVHLESVFPRTPRQRQGAHQLPLRTTCVADGSARETCGFAPRSGSRRLRLGEAPPLWLANPISNECRCIDFAIAIAPAVVLPAARQRRVWDGDKRESETAARWQRYNDESGKGPNRESKNPAGGFMNRVSARAAPREV